MTFLMNNWYTAGWAHEIGRALFARRILGKNIVLFRKEGGSAVALEDRCAHKQLPLSMGELNGDTVQCGYHGMTFDCAGTCVRIPGQASIPPTARVRAYPTAEKLGMVWIWMGDPALADPATIFDLPQYDDPDWGVNKGPYTHVEANYQHITDNLLDPAHVSFVHKTTLGSPASEDIPVETRVEDGTVIVTRWTNDSAPIPLFKQIANFAGTVDRWQFYYCYPPAICITDFGSVDAGASHADVDLDKGVRIYSCHFLTPETERTSHYFWMQVRNMAPDDAALSAKITEQFVLAFDEDRSILSAVQAASEAPPSAPPVKLAIDNGPNRSRRIVARMIKEERAAAAAPATSA